MLLHIMFTARGAGNDGKCYFQAKTLHYSYPSSLFSVFWRFVGGDLISELSLVSLLTKTQQNTQQENRFNSDIFPPVRSHVCVYIDLFFFHLWSFPLSMKSYSVLRLCRRKRLKKNKQKHLSLFSSARLSGASAA